MKQKTRTPSQAAISTDKNKPRTAKKKYRVTNWHDYNKALVARGSVTFWLSADVLDSWNKPTQSGKAGHPKNYSDIAIQAALTIQAIYHLPLRATEGFVQSLLFLLGCPHLKSPDYSTLSYRSSDLTVPMSSSARRLLASGEKLHIAIDSTGVKIFGEGEWKVRKHGWSKRRTWRKVHLGVDVSTNLIVAGQMTDRDTADSYMVEPLIDQIPNECTVGEILGDGAYDKWDLYDYCLEKDITLTVPPRSGAKDQCWHPEDPRYRPAQSVRNEVVRTINKLGIDVWKNTTGYHKRSLSETAMFRLKTIFGSSLTAREAPRQATQVAIRLWALNEMTLLGMPKSVVIT